MPDQTFLRESFGYDQASSATTWCVRPRHHFANEGQWRRWNKLYAGKPAASSRHRFGHAQICLMDQNWPAHRLIWKWMTGEDPPEVDHVDGDPTNNAWHNLRASTSTDSNRNRRRLATHSTGLKGVSKVSGSRGFGAKIRINGKPTWLGTFATPEAAHAAYCAAARKHFGPFWNPG